MYAAAAVAATAGVALTRPLIDVRHAVEAPRAIIIVLIDALRRDHVSCYGYHRQTTPNIDAVAADGVRFEDAYTNGSWTKPAVASLFTGLWPSETGALTMMTQLPNGEESESVLAGDVRTLAEALSRQGFRCGGFVNNPHLAEELGFGRGFDSYEQAAMTCDVIVGKFLEWRRALASDESYFAYMHFLEPHATYAPREPFRTRFLSKAEVTSEETKFSEYAEWVAFRNEVNEKGRPVQQTAVDEMLDLYDGEIAWTDEAVGTLVKALKADGLYEEAFLVIMADHGEDFLEHGVLEHPIYGLYEEQIRIPLVMKFPKSWGIGPGVVEGRAQTADITATICAAAGADGLGRGRDLIGACALGAITETATVTQGVGRFAVRLGGLKSECREEDGKMRIAAIYDIPKDPMTRHNILSKKPSYAARTTRRLERWFDFVGTRAPSARAEEKRVVPSEERLRQLRALGYL